MASKSTTPCRFSYSNLRSKTYQWSIQFSLQRPAIFLSKSHGVIKFFENKKDQHPTIFNKYFKPIQYSLQQSASFPAWLLSAVVNFLPVDSKLQVRLKKCLYWKVHPAPSKRSGTPHSTVEETVLICKASRIWSE